MKSVTFITVICLVCCNLVVTKKPGTAICCIPDQFEANAFLGYGNVFIDSTLAPETAYSYINGSVKISYDYTNARSYLFLNGTEVSPLIPGSAVPFITTIISDFKTGIAYQIMGNGDCQKNELGNMTKQCVLDGGKEVVYGFIAATNNKGVANYEFITEGDLTMKIAATVIRKDLQTCLPVHVVFKVGSANPDSGVLYSLDVMDGTEGIKDPSVFKPPPHCLHAKKSREEERDILRRLGLLGPRY